MLAMHEAPETEFARVHEMGIRAIQLLFDERYADEAGAQRVASAAAQNDLEITTIFCGFPGESYNDVPTIHRTVGLVPAETRAERIALIDTISRFAQHLNVNRVAAHIGFIPDDEQDEEFVVLVKITADICQLLASRGQDFALETGQEKAATLKRFIESVEAQGQKNLRVNFDPANMILYGNDDPIAATPLLLPWIDGVHCKDGVWPTEAQKTSGLLGAEVPWGDGDVNAEAWLTSLVQSGFRGPFTIEREVAREEQSRDVTAAKEKIEATLSRLGITSS
jgi:sugar phosphate isomerase/epimerase